jgi:hypothetical protein
VNKSTILTVLIVSSLSHAADLKDPFLRDDDVSGASVEVRVNVDNAGNYVYQYDVLSPETSTGYILSFDLDVTCGEPVDQKGFAPADYQTGRTSDRSEGIPHVPVAIDAPSGQAASPSLTAASRASWMVAMPPGGSSVGLTVVSPYPPGDRTYWLIPSVDYGWDEYDYETALKSENRDSIPWINDWTVSGIVAGPACPGDEYPDDGDGNEDSIFFGTLFEGEVEAQNQLLTYSAPLQDQFHQADGPRELEMIIHCHADIDPKSFVVTPQRHGIRALFHPVPGTSETIRLPLDVGKNRIELQVRRRFAPPVKPGQSGAVFAGGGGSSLDKDVFVVRVPVDSSAPGQGKGSNK